MIWLLCQDPIADGVVRIWDSEETRDDRRRELILQLFFQGWSRLERIWKEERLYASGDRSLGQVSTAYINAVLSPYVHDRH